MRAWPWIVVLASCGGSDKPTTTTPTTTALPAATTTCYAGLDEGMGQTTRVIAKRTVDPAAGVITEDVANDDQGAHGANHFHVTMKVDGDHFAMTEDGGAFTGEGTLTGEAWKWTSWESTAQIPNAPITVISHDDITADGMVTSKEIKQGDKVVATTHEDLKMFDCATWDAELARLQSPAASPEACEAACRNYATLKMTAEGKAQADIDAEMSKNLGGCVQECITANNGAATACLSSAKSVDELPACFGGE